MAADVAADEVADEVADVAAGESATAAAPTGAAPMGPPGRPASSSAVGRSDRNACWPSGDIAAWPVVESIQRDGVCAEVIAPAHGASVRLREAAEEMARGIAEGLGVTGVLAVEDIGSPADTGDVQPAPGR